MAVSSGIVLLDISVSLDGFVAGPGDDVGRLHEWALVDNQHFSDEVHEVFAEAGAGAVITGRRTFDLASGWGGKPALPVPYVVVSHEPPPPGDWSSFVFVTGIEAAVARAHELAGGRNVYVMGGAATARQCLSAGLLDEIQLHVSPVLFGDGIRLFDHLGGRVELELVKVFESVRTVRMRYRVVR
jgi:dihydrofolate reductase